MSQSIKKAGMQMTCSCEIRLFGPPCSRLGHVEKYASQHVALNSAAFFAALERASESDSRYQEVLRFPVALFFAQIVMNPASSWPNNARSSPAPLWTST